MFLTYSVANIFKHKYWSGESKFYFHKKCYLYLEEKNEKVVPFGISQKYSDICRTFHGRSQISICSKALYSKGF